MAKTTKLGTRRTFGSKTYHIYEAYWNKQRAENDAKRLRKQGSLARVTKTSATEGHYLYTVWIHN